MAASGEIVTVWLLVLGAAVKVAITQKRAIKRMRMICNLCNCERPDRLKSTIGIATENGKDPKAFPGFDTTLALPRQSISYARS